MTGSGGSEHLFEGQCIQTDSIYFSALVQIILCRYVYINMCDYAGIPRL